MSFYEAMSIVNKFGAKYWCNSLIDTVIEMEKSMPYLTEQQIKAFQVVVGSLDEMVQE